MHRFVSSIALFALLSSAACSKEEAKKTYESAKSTAGDLASAAGEKASAAGSAIKDAAVSAGEKASELAGQAKDAAVAAGEKAGELATAAKDKASSLITGAKSSLEVVSSIKKEFDAVYQSGSAYDIEIATEGIDDAGMKALEDQLKGLPNVTVNGVTIAYEDRTANSINGVNYAKAFGAIWVVGGKKIGLIYATQQNIDAKAFAELLQKLAPVVEKYAK